MAGNGKQLWQRWSWRDAENKKLSELQQGESGEGLMEALAFHPSGETFAMGGRLRGGDWNVALFDLASGSRIGTIKSGYRVTDMAFTADGKRLVLVERKGNRTSWKTANSRILDELRCMNCETQPHRNRPRASCSREGI